MNTITRKISLSLVGEVKEGYKKLREWNEMAVRAANTAVSHLYFQNNMKEFFYITESGKILFTDINKPLEKVGEKEKSMLEDGYERVLNTSKQNTTYQVLSSRYKGKMPSDIFSNLNAQISATFAKEAKEYFTGKRSLRTYRRTMPIPFSSSNMRNITLCENKKDYTFDLLGLKFKTFFGKDLSGNRIIFERALAGEYKLCNSFLQLDGKNLNLLAVFQFASEKYQLDADKVMHAELSAHFPIVLTCDKKTFNIGTASEYLYRRIAIQGALKKLQYECRFNNGGDGRELKLSPIKRFRELERRYINQKQHMYIRKMVDICLQQKCSKVILKFTPEIPEPAAMSREELILWRAENQLLLRNWSYFGLKEKTIYKFKAVGIEVEIEEPPTKEKKEK